MRRDRSHKDAGTTGAVHDRVATAAAPYLGPACSVPVFILQSIFSQNPFTILLAPGFERCSHKAMNKKDIGFNGLTKREESFKKKQNKCITTVVRIHMVFSVDGAASVI